MIRDEFDLSGKVALITGGTGVLGSEMARGLAEAGAYVAVLGRRKDAGRELADGLKVKGYKAISVSADVLNAEELLTAKKEVLEAYGSIDILVNAAGGNMPGATIPPENNFFDLDIDDFKRVVDLNLLGSVLPTRLFTDVMAEKGKGVVINISSMAALTTITRVVGYSAAK
ncbi:MAG TPA: SDR family NAD(P)-dependent oxidoreductase, partial [Cyclobacteriaceae bacterium]|nr:SDR family NAD(P)-dependent oxidoreductase [Cyclobacteriaceae bacterium]